MSVLRHHLQNGSAQGPISEEQRRGLVISGAPRAADQVWHEALENWIAMQAIPELAPIAWGAIHGPLKKYRLRLLRPIGPSFNDLQALSNPLTNRITAALDLK